MSTRAAALPPGPARRLSGFHLVVRTMVRSAGRDLSLRQLDVLLTIQAPGNHTIRDLAEALACPKSAITRAVDCLEKYRLAFREADPAGARSVLVRPTPSGTRTLTALGIFHPSGPKAATPTPQPARSRIAARMAA
jgi:DNA-binding MarR family transcriptional regulator